MNADFMFVLLSIITVVLVIWAYFRFVRAAKPANTKSLSEFLKFAQEQGCQYVAIYTAESVVTHSTDHAEVHYYVIASTMDPFGFKLSYKERTASLDATYNLSMYTEARKDNAHRAQQINDQVKVALSSHEKPFLVSIQGQHA